MRLQRRNLRDPAGEDVADARPAERRGERADQRDADLHGR